MDIPLLHFRCVGSTMEKARELLPESHDETFIVVADEQSAGRGRIEGRTWEGMPGASLLMTLCLKGDYSATEALPLRIGLAVHAVLSESTPSRLRIKWPNDIMGIHSPGQGQSGKNRFGKLGGLLCETTEGWLLAGIGLNLKPEAYPPAMRDRATSLTEIAETAQGLKPAGLPATEALALMIGKAVVSRLESKDWREAYESVMWALGEEVFFIVGHPGNGSARRGTVRGVDDAGRILLQCEGGEIEAFWSGEISGLTVSAPGVASLQRP